MHCLSIDNIPTCLWSEEMVILPNELCELFIDRLKELDKFEESLYTHKRGVIGGKSKEEVISHFVHRFPTSAARVEYLLLDPKQKFGKISNNLLTVLSSGRIAILDIPCGTGAGIISLLMTIATLRAEHSIVQLPLYIHLMGGDYSDEAIKIYNELLTKIKPYLSRYSIHIKFNTRQWDASHPGQTSEIMDEWFSSTIEAEEYFVFIAAFSGAVADKFEEYDRSVQHIAERLFNKPSIILWVEPKSNKSDKLFKKLIKMFKKILWFSDEKEAEVTFDQFKWFHPVKEKIIEGGNVAVKKYSYHSKI